jgi:gliding motility-associated-like protein
MKDTQKNRLAIIGTVGVPARYGGFETLAHHLVEQLGDTYDLTVYCSGTSYPKGQRLKHWKNARLVYLPLSANGLSSILYDLLSLFHALFYSHYLLVLGVSAGVFFPFLKKLSRKPLIVNIDGLEWRRNKWNRWARAYLRFAEKMAVRAADVVIADNPAIADYVRDTYGREARMIPYGGDHVFPVAIKPEDLEAFPFLQQPYAFKVCRIEPENHIHIVLEAFARFGDLPLVLVGNWQHSEYGKRLWGKYQGHPNLRLLPPVYDPRTLNLLRSNCQLYVHGHAAGGTNPSLVEAMSLGRPILAKDVVYNRFSTEQQALFFQDEQELLDQLQGLSPDRLQEQGLKMQQIAQRLYRWETIAQAYADCLEGKPQPKPRASSLAISQRLGQVIPFLLLIFMLSLFGKLPAQLVTTVAGQAGVAGETDGFARAEARFNNPHGLAVGPQGNVYIADRFNHKIRMLTPSGEVVTLAGTGEVGSEDGPGGIATFYEPWALDVDGQGNVYIADTYNHKIRVLNAQGIVSTLAGSGSSGVTDGPGNVARFALPSGIAVDANGLVYVCDHLGHTIRKVSPGGYVTTLAGSAFATGDANGQGTSARFNRPYGLDVDQAGNIYIADEWNHLIRKLSPTGLVSTFAGSGSLGSADGPVANAQFNYPWDLAVDSLGQLFVMDGENHVIRKIDPAGQVSTFVGEAGTKGAVDGMGSKASFNGATALCFAPVEQSLYVADAYNHLVRKVSTGQAVGLQLSAPLGQDSFCMGETLSLLAFPQSFGQYEFFVNGQSVQVGPEPLLSLVADQADSLRIGVEASDANGNNFRSADLLFWVHKGPEVDFEHRLGSRTAGGLEVSFEALAPQDCQLSWDFGDPTSGAANVSEDVSPSHTYALPGTYDVLLVGEDPLGCRDSVLKGGLITYTEGGTVPTGSTLPGDRKVFLPTAFTPNQDGLNDVLYLRGNDIEQVDFQIFDQWGSCIFRSNSLDQGWDGSQEGIMLPSDTYLCVAHLQFSDGSRFTFHGQTTLLR